MALIGLAFDVLLLGYQPTGRWPVPLAAPVATLVAGVSAWIGYRNGDRMVLASSLARPLRGGDPNAQVLGNVVEEMAIAAGIPAPAVWVIDDDDPNAFATGRAPEHASIAVTRGLLAALSRDELQGVIGHEIAHIRNYDIRTMTIVAALLGGVVLLSEWGSRLRVRGRDRDEGPAGLASTVVVVLGLVALVVAPLVGRLLAMAVSRRREYDADATAAELTRNPLGLAKALRKLEAAAAPTRRIARGTAHLCITDPLGRRLSSRDGALADLLATHPPIGKRIALLEQLAYAR